jgi:hypothetical protein
MIGAYQSRLSSGSQDNTVAEHEAVVGKTLARQAYRSSRGCTLGREHRELERQR